MTTAAQPIQTAPKHFFSKKAKRSIILWIVFLPLVFLIFFPLLYMVSMSFTSEVDQFQLPIRWIPSPPTLMNYKKIMADPLIPLGRWFLNSLIVASIGTVVIMVVSSLSGYAFARLEFPGKNFLFSLLLFSLMIPAAITLIPIFLLLRDLKLLDTYYAIWLPGAAAVTGIFLLRQHFFSIPVELEDAARVDGADRFRIYWQICLPLVRGALVALAIFSFLALWNDLFWPLIVLTNLMKLTLPIGLVVLQQGSYIQRGLAFAAAFITTVPVMIFYAVFQRKIIAGITTAGLAGR